MLRYYLFKQIRNITRAGTQPVDFTTPAGDPGLFGPNSVCWKVHQDFTSMMVGGIAALLLQTLHPRALAGVWDHSNFREDLKGRLGRTAFFLSTTTYGGTAAAEQAIARVRRIHERVVGTTPDGRAYAASESDLLIWVHVTEVTSFLAAYLKYVNPSLSGAEQDQYYAEMASIAERLGAREVPRNRQAISDYLAAQLPQLQTSSRTHDVIAVLNQFEPRLASQLFIRAGYLLLPSWARDVLGAKPIGSLSARCIDSVIRCIAPPIRWALVKYGITTQARVRAAQAPRSPALAHASGETHLG